MSRKFPDRKIIRSIAIAQPEAAPETNNEDNQPPIGRDGLRQGQKCGSVFTIVTYRASPAPVIPNVKAAIYQDLC